MSTSETMVACPDIQDSIDNNFQTCNSRGLTEPMPFFEFLNSELNRSGYSQKVSPGQGKLMRVQQTYTQRISESQVTQPGTAYTCEAETKRGNLSTYCDIDPLDYYEVEELIVDTDFRRVCESNASIVAGKMNDMISALRRKTATVVTDQAVALIGGVNSTVASSDKVDVSGTDFYKIATKKSAAAGGDIDPVALATIDYLNMQNAYCQQAPIFGGEIYRYAQLMQAGCCAATGINLAEILRLYGKAIMYDKRVVAALGGPEYAIMPLPGALQIVWYNQNDNGIAEAAGISSGADYQKMIVFDPQTGMPIDLTLKDDCGNLSIIMRANAKVCALPTDLFGPGDQMEGVTFVNGIKIVNPA